MTERELASLKQASLKWVLSTGSGVSYCVSTASDIFASMQTSLAGEYDIVVSLYRGWPKGKDNHHYTQKDKVFCWITHAMDYAEEQVMELSGTPLPPVG